MLPRTSSAPIAAHVFRSTDWSEASLAGSHVVNCQRNLHRVGWNGNRVMVTLHGVFIIPRQMSYQLYMPVLHSVWYGLAVCGNCVYVLHHCRDILFILHEGQ